MTDIGCDEFRQMSAEVALGIASARSWTSAIEHLQGCEACRSELRDLSDIADTLTTLAPPAEPSAGFESRVVSTLIEARRPLRLRRLIPHRALLAAAAAVAVIAGIGGWLAADQSSSAPAVASGKLMAAPLLSSGRTVGELIVTTGDDGWMSMWLHTGSSNEAVTCELRLKTGTFVTVGTFTLSHGYGYWAAPVPGGISPTGAQLIAANRVLAETGNLSVLRTSRA